ncbi:MAG: radical SAM peptide maturase [Bacteroidaceae bacterium]|nr:radical SAM peptide maturase [Bacteroidaceae bacterium]
MDMIIETKNGYKYIWQSQVDYLGYVPSEIYNYVEGSLAEKGYYYKKFHYLKEKGFFQNSLRRNKIYIISDDDVKREFLNTPQIVFEVTDFCNLNCKYCGYGDMYENHGKRHSKKMPKEYVKSFFDYLTKNWNDIPSSRDNIVISFYGGEPLLNFEFIKHTVMYVNGNNQLRGRVTYSFTTNGLLLNKYLDFLVENNFNILISLDGDEISNDYRQDWKGRVRFQEIRNNIILIRTKFPEYFEHNINFNAVLHDKNTLKGILDYFYSEFGKIPMIGELTPIGIKNQDEYGKMRRSFYKEFVRLEENSPAAMSKYRTITPLFRESVRFLKTTPLLCYERGFRYLFNAKSKTKTALATGTCIPFSKKVFIRVDGKITICEKIGDSVSVGELNESNIDIDYRKAAEIYNKSVSRYSQKCNTCPRYDFCNVCGLTDITRGRVCSPISCLSSVSKILGYLEKDSQAFSVIQRNTITL